MLLTSPLSSPLKNPARDVFSPAASSQSLTAQVQALFASRAGGMWDFGDTSTLFQDTAGSTPITAVTQPIGRVNDKSGLGNHATQPTAGSRPLFSARKNMLTKSEQFNDGVWVNSLIAVSTDSATAPDGSVTAEKLCPTVVSGAHVMVQNAFTVGTGVAVLSVYAKAAEYTRVGLRESATTGAWAVFDLSGGTVLGSGGGTSSTSITSIGNGWYRCSITVSAVSAGVATHVVSPSWTSGSPNGHSYTGNGTDGIYAWGAQLEQVALSRYQRVNTASDYDTVGFPAFAQFDATDDALLFPAITFGGAFNTFVAGKVTGGTQGVHLWRTADWGGGYWGVYQSGSAASPAGANAGSPTYSNNGIAVSPQTRAQIYTLINGVDSVVESIGVTLSAETALQFSGYPALPFIGNAHRVLMISGTLTAAEKLLCRQWCAEGNGVTVV